MELCKANETAGGTRLKAANSKFNFMFSLYKRDELWLKMVWVLDGTFKM